MQIQPAATARGRTTYINGKFLSQHTTGVQRTASGLLSAVDAELCAMGPGQAGRWVLLCPPGLPSPPLRYIEVRTIGKPGGTKLMWEQWRLPRDAADGTLLNLAGSAPALHRRQICMLHDAAIFDRPEAYTLLFRTWYRMLFRLLSHTARTLLTVSEYSAERLRCHLAIRANRLHVVHNGADHLGAVGADDGVFPYYGIEPGAYVLAVGSSNPNKNLPMLEDVMRRFHGATGIRLVLVGGINSKVFVHSKADDIGDGVVVVRTGPVTDGQLKALYQHALALVFPSLYEGFGLPPLEAMSCGCPVLASNSSAIPEICGDGAAYFDPQSPEQVERLLRRLVDEPQWRDELRAAGHERVRAFSWGEAARKLLGHVSTVSGV